MRYSLQPAKPLKDSTFLTALWELRGSSGAL